MSQLIFNALSAPVGDRYGTYIGQNANTNHPFSFQIPAPQDPRYPATYSASLADGTPLPGWLTFDPGRQTFSGTPRKTDVGTAKIAVKITYNAPYNFDDVHTGTSISIFYLDVLERNNPPTVVNPIPAQATIIDRPFGYIVPDNTFTDFDGGTPTYSVTLADGSPLPGWLIFNPATRTFSGTPSVANYGLINVSVKATDSAQESNSSIFVLNIDIDAAQYGASYNDLIGSYGYNLAGLSEHYRAAGRTEGRKPDTFDEYRYLAGYDDLLNIYKTDVVGVTQHYITQGAKASKGAEGRDPLAFKSDIYLASHKDLLDAVKPIADYSKKLEFASSHYVLHGRGEGRLKEIFNPAAYLAANLDIAPIYGNDPTAHYILHGYGEMRTI